MVISKYPVTYKNIDFNVIVRKDYNFFNYLKIYVKIRRTGFLSGIFKWRTVYFYQEMMNKIALKRVNITEIVKNVVAIAYDRLRDNEIEKQQIAKFNEWDGVINEEI